MDSLLLNQTTLWFIIGFTLLAIELLVFGFASGVLLFGGIGALITGAALWFELIPHNFIVAVVRQRSKQ